MIEDIIDKYISDGCGAPKKKKKQVMESYDFFMGWNTGIRYIYTRDNSILWSNAPGFESGSDFTFEDRKRAQAYGYIILDW